MHALFCLEQVFMFMKGAGLPQNKIHLASFSNVVNFLCTRQWKIALGHLNILFNPNY